MWVSIVNLTLGAIVATYIVVSEIMKDTEKATKKECCKILSLIDSFEKNSPSSDIKVFIHEKLYKWLGHLNRKKIKRNCYELIKMQQGPSDRICIQDAHYYDVEDSYYLRDTNNKPGRITCI